MKLKTKENLGIFILLIAILFSSIFAAVGQKIKTENSSLSAETLRAMNYAQVESEEVENCSNLIFSAFFTRDLDGDNYAEKMLGTCKEIGYSDTMYINIGLNGDGYFKDGVITIDGQNFNYSMQMVKDSVLKNNYVSNNVSSIELNEIHSGMQKLLVGEITSKISTKNDYTKVNTVTLTGTYVSNENEETEINQSVNLTVDWYGSARANVHADVIPVLYSNLKKDANETGTVDSFQLDFRTEETRKKLIPYLNETTVKIPEVFGEYPIEVDCGSGVYDEETHTCTFVTNTNSRTNYYRIKVKYSQEVMNQAYSGQTINFDINTKYECYNNENEEFTNPVVATAVGVQIVEIKPSFITKQVEYLFSHKILNGQYQSIYETTCISKDLLLKAYEQEDNIENMTYEILWRVQRTSYNPQSTEEIGCTFREISSDKIGSLSANDYLASQKIYFDNRNFVSKTGKLYLYNNDTNELIEEFSYNDLANYTYTNPYEISTDVKSLRAVTSEETHTPGQVIDIYTRKEIDCEKIKNEIQKSIIEDAGIMISNIRGILSNGSTSEGSDSVRLITEKNKFYASISNKTLTTTDTDEVDETFTIVLPAKSMSFTEWKNGIFVFELPENIINAKIDEILVSNTDLLDIAGYEIYKLNNKYYIKIITNNEVLTSGVTITIKTKLLLNPLANTTRDRINVYGYNENYKVYFNEVTDTLDINGDGNVSELIEKEIIDVNVIAPTSFVSAEQVSNYGTEGEITVAPHIAELSKTDRSAKISVQFANNYTESVDNVRIIGKIPFQGNTYIGGTNLGSEFSTTMKNTGIEFSDEYSSFAKVYYSTVESPEDDDITNENNHWVLASEMSDLSSVKTYLIVLENYRLQYGKIYTFTYDVTIPENITVNKAAYSCHIVYFDLQTKNGKLATSVQPNKVGLRITRYYNLELNKYKEGTTLGIQGAKYMLTEVTGEEDEPSRLIISNAQGKLLLNNLRANQRYKLKEIQAPINYELDDSEIEFVVSELQDGTLEFTKHSTAGFGSAVTLTNILNKDVMKASLFDVPKFKINIHKIDKDDNSLELSGVIFNINGNNIRTNSLGRVSAEGLYLDTWYTLSERSATGYYLNTIVFRIKKENGNLVFETQDTYDCIKSTQVTNSDLEDLVQLDIEITNEKIATYNLKIVKQDSNVPELKLKGAKFLLEEEDKGTAKFVTTDSNGEIQLTGLYQYVDGKEVTGKYKIHEIKAPEGYVLNEEEIEFYFEKDEEDKLVAHITDEGDLSTVGDITVDGINVQMIIRDNAYFKILKKDAETGEVLANAKFAIYSYDYNRGMILDYAKDPYGEYIGEQNADGIYVVTTDENGIVTAPLSNGYYKMVEIDAPFGYKNKSTNEVFRISGNSVNTDVEDLEINYIEDLLFLDELINSGSLSTTFSAKLMRTLDFTDRESYKNPDSKSYKDLNNDGIIDTLYVELTKTTKGTGFPVLGSNMSFMGTFDGQGYEIKNLYINSSEENVGLFGNALAVTIKNLGVTGNIISLSNNDATGGIVGRIQGTIMNCYFKGVIRSNANYTGGICGYEVDSSQILKSYNNATIYAEEGNNSEYDYVGGIVGCSSAAISNCYNTGNINTSSDYKAIGGVAGRINSSMTSCYNVGLFNIEGENSNYQFGGVTNYSYNTYYSYYLNECIPSGKTSASYGTSKTSDELKAADIITSLGSTNWQQDTNNVNNGYLILKPEQTSTGSTSTSTPESDIIEINYIEDLVQLSKNVTAGKGYHNKIVKLMRTLDFNDDASYRESTNDTCGDLNNNNEQETIKEELTNPDGNGFLPIGTESNDKYFYGIFDGQGYEIRNIHIKARSGYYSALFGRVEHAIIKNVGVTGSIVGANYAAGICGEAEYTNIINCYNKATITAQNTYANYAAGICCRGGSAEGCYNFGEIINNGSGSAFGIGSDTIKNCFNAGDIKGKYSFGIGREYANIYNSYNIGNIGTENTQSAAQINKYYSSNYFEENCYGLDTVVITGTVDENTNTIIKDETYMKSTAFVTDLGEDYWQADINNINNGYPIPKQVVFDEESTFEINYVEDWVRIYQKYEDGKIYNLNIELKRDLDFASDDSYLNPLDDSFGDLNKDETIEGIKAEINNSEANFVFRAFMHLKNIKIEGNNHSIYNYHSDRGLSYYAYSFEARNLNLNITMNISNNSGAFVSEMYRGNSIIIDNCNVYGENHGGTDVGGFIGYAMYANEIRITNSNNYSNVYGAYAAGAIGYTHTVNSIVIDNFNNYGDMMASSSNAAGIIGMTSDAILNLEILNSSNQGEIKSLNGNAGGFVGYVSNGTNGVMTIENCYNTGSVYGTNRVGGFTGYQSSVGKLYVRKSHNSGNVSGPGGASSISGLLAYGYANSLCIIEDCYNEGNVTLPSGSGYNGGIIGEAGGSATYYIINVYNTGKIEGAYRVGGLIGSPERTMYMKNSYNLGEVSGVGGSYYVGGLVGYCSTSDMTIEACYNMGKISQLIGGQGYVAGIMGYFGSNNIVKNTYNKGDIFVEGSSNYLYVGGLGSYTYGKLSNCYNAGNIYVSNSAGSKYIGGITGWSSGTLSDVYNLGNITVENVNAGNNTVAICGIGTSVNGERCYNKGNINVDLSAQYVYICGITMWGNLYNSYNTGNIYLKNSLDGTNISNYVSGIMPNGSTCSNCYSVGDVIVETEEHTKDTIAPVWFNGSDDNYPDYLYYLNSAVITEGNITGNVQENISKTSAEMKSQEFVNLLNTNSTELGKGTPWIAVNNDYPTLDINLNLPQISGSTEIIVPNEKMDYQIKGSVLENYEGRRYGGTINGVKEGVIETVKYSANSTEAISIEHLPGYTLEEIRINDEKVEFILDNDGNVTIPVGYFTNVSKDYLIEARFERIDKIVYLNKVDTNGESLTGAKFDIEQTQYISRNELDTFTQVPVVASIPIAIDSTGVIGEQINHNETYYFVKNADGDYVSNNQDRNSTTAGTSIPIDLTDLSGEYVLLFDYIISSEGSYDCGVIKLSTTSEYINKSTSGLYDKYSGSAGTLVKDNQIGPMTGGQIYYFNMGYEKDGSARSGTDTFTVKNIRICQLEDRTYNFVETNGKYISNNTTKAAIDTDATAYIPVMLEGATGYYDITINAELVGTNNIGIIGVGNSNTTYLNNIANITEPTEAQDYTITVPGGVNLYLTFKHTNGFGTETGDNYLQINSVNVTLSEESFLHKNNMEVDENGQIKMGLGNGVYRITEIQAPEGYKAREDSMNLTITDDSTISSIDFVNEKCTKVITHYLENGTGPEFDLPAIELSVSTESYGAVGEEYTTMPKMMIDNYELIKDENDEYILPGNANGVYEDETIDVYYYYEEPEYLYTVNHYFMNKETRGYELEYTDTAYAQAGAVIVENDLLIKTRTGYVVSRISGAPLIIATDIENEINVYYDLDTFFYRIEYYGRDTEEDTYEIMETESKLAEYQDVIDEVEAKNIKYYTKEREEGLPLTISDDETQNVIRVYYIKSKYVVEHYKEQADGTYLVADVDNIFGAVGDKVSAVAKNYDGFTLDEDNENAIPNGEIKDNEVLTLELYYNINRYTLTLQKNDAIDLVAGAGTYKAGEEVEISALLSSAIGYTYNWSEWEIVSIENDGVDLTDNEEALQAIGNISAINSTIEMPVGNVVLKAKGIKTPVEYNISYFLGREAYLPDNKTNPESYTIETPDFTLNNPVRDGYDFQGWTGGVIDDGLEEAPITNPTTTVTIAQGSIGNRTYVGSWEARDDTEYAVEHYKEKLDGTYELADTDHLAGITDEEVSATARTYSGFTFDPDNENNVIEGTIAGDGSLVLKLYYARNSYTLTLEKDDVVAQVFGSGEYKFGQEVTIIAALDDVVGYTTSWGTWQVVSIIDDDVDLTDNEDALQALGNISLQTSTIQIPLGNVTLKANGLKTPIDYEISYFLGKEAYLEEGVTNPTSYTIETADFTLNNPLRDGYDFLGWTGGVIDDGSEEAPITVARTSVTIAQGSIGNRSYVGNWEARNDTEYAVEHYLEKLDGTYELKDTEHLVGITDEEISASPRTYPGFTFDENNENNVLEGTIAGDGSLVLKVYYTRNSYTLTLQKNDCVETVTGAGTYKYEEEVEISAELAELVGYTTTWGIWQVVSIIDDDVDLTDNEEALQALGNIALQTSTIEMPTGNVTLKANGLKTPIEYEISYFLGRGNLPENVTNPTSYTIETPDITLNNPIRDGYNFLGWTGGVIDDGSEEAPITEPTVTVTIAQGSIGNRTYNAVWEAEESTEYKVEHYLEKLDGTYELKDIENLVGATDEEVAASPRTYSGFTFDENNENNVLEGVIAYDGSLVLKVYYTRNSYTLTLQKDETIETVTGAGTYKFEEEVEISAELAEILGYSAEWNKWDIISVIDDNNEDISARDAVVEAIGDISAQTSTIGMPAGNVTLKATGVKTPVEYEISYFLGREAYLPDNKTNPESYTIETPDFTLNNPVREGYDFQGWTGGVIDDGATEEPITDPTITVTIAQGSTGNRSYVGSWEARDDTAYTVKHYLEKLDGTYELRDTENLVGVTDEEVAAIPRTYQGFTFDENNENNVLEGTVESDGSLVLKVYYTRNSYTLVLEKDENIGSVSGAGTYKYEEQVEISAVLAEITGYTTAWGTWQVVSIIDDDVDLTDNEETLQAIGDISAQTSTIEIPAGNVTLKATGTKTTIEYEISYYLGKEAYLEEGVTNPETYTIETPTFTLNNPLREGYNFLGWTGGVIDEGATEEPITDPTITVTIPQGSTGNRTYVGSWEARDDTAYIVEHYLEKLDGTYELRDTENLVGVTDEEVAAIPRTYPGFTFDEDNENNVAEGTVEPDGSLVLKLYYTRNSYTLTLEKDENIGSVVGAGTYKYEEEVEISAVLADVAGYTTAWDKWLVVSILDGENDLTEDQTALTAIGDISAINSTIEMPLGNVTLKATGTRTIIEYTIQYILNNGTIAEGANPETYTVETPDITLVNPTKQGYVFEGWTGGVVDGTSNDYITEPNTEVVIAQGSIGDRVYTANWVGDPKTPYTVEHYLEKLDGTYELADTDELEGTTGGEVVAARRKYTGYTFDENNVNNVLSGNVLADGSLVLKVYYNRNLYTLRLIAGDNVNEVSMKEKTDIQVLQELSGKDIQQQVKFGTPVTINSVDETETGYTITWDKWESSDSDLLANIADRTSDIEMPIGDVTLTAKSTKTINSYEYSVEYYYSGTLEETVNNTAEFNSVISTYEEKDRGTYMLERTENLPLTISSVEADNVIRVYYVPIPKPDIVVIQKSIAIKRDGTQVILDTESNNLKENSSITLTRKTFNLYESENGPASTADNVIVAGKEQNTVTVNYEEGKTIEVRFYYKKINSNVIVKYVNNLTGQSIKDDDIKTGIIGEEYRTDRIDIPGYRLDLDKLPDNENGEYQEDDITVVYSYIELQQYNLKVIYTADGKPINDVQLNITNDTGLNVTRTTVNGVADVETIEATELGTIKYEIYEENELESFESVLTQEKPGIVEIEKTLDQAQKRYEIKTRKNDIKELSVVVNNNRKEIIIRVDVFTKYNLAIKKFVSAVDDKPVLNKEPIVEVAEDGKITYKQDDKIEPVCNNQVVVYTLRVYNESDIIAKGKTLIEHIPDGLIYLPEDKINKQYGWKMYEVNDENEETETEKVSKASILKTDYMVNKKINPFNKEAYTTTNATGTNAGNTINATVPEVEEAKNYVDVQIAFKVDETKIDKDTRIIENTVSIMPNENDEHPDDDVTTERVYVKYFDLNITKFIKEVRVKGKYGNEAVRSMGIENKDELVKIDVAKSEVNDTVITVTYGLAIKNTGEIPGYVTELVDYIPQDFKLVDNGNWTVKGNKAIANLENKEIKPGETEVVDITFTWVLSEEKVGSRINEAEITKYSNVFNAKDITEDNKDKEELVTAVRTGRIKYITILGALLAVFGTVAITFIVVQYRRIKE